MSDILRKLAVAAMRGKEAVTEPSPVLRALLLDSGFGQIPESLPAEALPRRYTLANPLLTVTEPYELLCDMYYRHEFSISLIWLLNVRPDYAKNELGISFTHDAIVEDLYNQVRLSSQRIATARVNPPVFLFGAASGWWLETRCSMSTFLGLEALTEAHPLLSVDKRSPGLEREPTAVIDELSPGCWVDSACRVTRLVPQLFYAEPHGGRPLWFDDFDNAVLYGRTRSTGAEALRICTKRPRQIRRFYS